MADLAFDWRWIFARGVFAIIFGLILLLFPITGLVTIALLFALYAVCDGAMALSAAWRMKNKKGRGLILFEGVTGILAGILAIFYPGAALLALLVLVSAWAVLRGLAKIYFAYTFQDILSHPVLFGLAGLVSFLLGVAILVWPTVGLMTLLAMLAAYSILFGFFLTFWSLRLRQLTNMGTKVHAV